MQLLSTWSLVFFSVGLAPRALLVSAARLKPRSQVTDALHHGSDAESAQVSDIESKVPEIHQFIGILEFIQIFKDFRDTLDGADGAGKDNMISLQDIMATQQHVHQNEQRDTEEEITPLPQEQVKHTYIKMNDHAHYIRCGWKSRGAIFNRTNEEHVKIMRSNLGMNFKDYLNMTYGAVYNDFQLCWKAARGKITMQKMVAWYMEKQAKWLMEHQWDPKIIEVFLKLRLPVRKRRNKFKQKSILDRMSSERNKLPVSGDTEEITGDFFVESSRRMEAMVEFMQIDADRDGKWNSEEIKNFQYIGTISDWELLHYLMDGVKLKEVHPELFLAFRIPDKTLGLNEWDVSEGWDEWQERFNMPLSRLLPHHSPPWCPRDQDIFS